MVKNVEPTQFNFLAKWNYEIREILDRPSIQRELEGIKENYRGFAEFKFEETSGWDVEKARAEYELDLHIASVRCQDLHWLRQTFEGTDLVNLSLAIAQELYPDCQWEILERDEDAIVTDKKRKMVFDMKNFDKLSAPASLCLMNDDYGLMNDRALEEVSQFLGDRIQFFERSLKVMKEHLH